MNVRAELSPPFLGSASSDLSAGAPGTEADYSTRYVWYVVFLLSVVNVFNYMDRMALAVLLPAIKKDLSVSDGQLGLLVGLAFFLFYAICGIPVARYADRGIRRNVIAATLTIWSVMTALSGAAQNFWHLLVARVGLGAGEAGCIPAGQSIIADYVPLKRRPAVYAVHNLGFIAGVMLGLTLAGALGEAIGWRWTFVVLGLPGIALAVVVRLTLREPTRGFYDAMPNDPGTPPLSTTIGTLWRCRTYRRLTIFLVANGFVQTGLQQWWPSFFERTFELSSSSVGMYLGFALGIGSGAGLLIGGYLSHRVAQRDVRSPLIIGAVALGLSLLTALGSLFVPSQSASAMLVLLTGLLWSVPSGATGAAVVSVTMPRMRATACALTLFCSSVFGFSLGPLCVGVMSDLLAPSLGVESLRYALLIPVCVIPLLPIALYAAIKVLPEDLRAAGARF